MSYQPPPGPPFGGMPPGGVPPGGTPPGGGYPGPGGFGGGAPPGGGAGAPPGGHWQPPPYGGYGPGGYPPPYPPPRPTRAPIAIRRRGQIEERGPVAVAVLSFVTCGVYRLYWLYVTGGELRETLDDQEIRPGIDVILSLLTCGLWAIYAEYRNAQRIHGALLSVDPYAKDQSEMTLILNVAGLFSGYVTWGVSAYIIQEELNKLARC